MNMSTVFFEFFLKREHEPFPIIVTALNGRKKKKKVFIYLLPWLKQQALLAHEDIPGLM